MVFRQWISLASQEDSTYLKYAALFLVKRSPAEVLIFFSALPDVELRVRPPRETAGPMAQLAAKPWRDYPGGARLRASEPVPLQPVVETARVRVGEGWLVRLPLGCPGPVRTAPAGRLRERRSAAASLPHRGSARSSPASPSRRGRRSAGRAPREGSSYSVAANRALMRSTSWFLRP